MIVTKTSPIRHTGPRLFWYNRGVGRESSRPTIEVPAVKSSTVLKFENLGYKCVVSPDGGKMRVSCPDCSKAWIVTDGFSAGVYSRVLQSLKVHRDGHAVKLACVEDPAQAVIPGTEVSDAKASAKGK